MRFLLSLVLAVQILFSYPPLFATTECNAALAQLGPVQGELPTIDKEDIKDAKNRRAFHQWLRAFFGEDPYKINPEDSDSVKQMKTLLGKREFSSYFRFKDVTRKNLDKVIPDFKALVKPLKTPQEGYLVKLMMIRQAEYTVDLTYYIFAQDNAGLALVHELESALKRGVNVRFMVDSLGSIGATMRGNPHLKALITYAKENAGYIKDPATGRLTNIKATVEVMVFNPVSNIVSPVRDFIVQHFYNLYKLANLEVPKKFKTTGWNPDRRSHDKILVVDAQFPSRSVAIIGGRNIADRYYELDPSDHANFRDAEVLIRNHPENYNNPERYSRIGEVLTDQYDRLYFHRANHRVTEGVVGRAFGRGKQNRKMAEASYKIEEVTQKTLRAIGEDFESKDFGKKYLSQGFDEAKVNVLNSIQNIMKEVPEPLEPLLMGVIKNSDIKNGQNLLPRIIESFAQENEAVTIISPYLWLSDGSKKGTIDEITLIKNWLKANPNRHLYVYTNSIITSDNPLAQSLVDVAMAPKLMLDPDIKGRVTVYEYGKIDDVALGGNKNYGKLHFKGIYFHGQKRSVITTYNKDPRSQYENSEVGVTIQGEIYAKNMEAEIIDIQSKSHLWGSDEFNAIRSHKKLSRMQRLNVENQKRIFWLLEKFHLWMFI